MAKNLDGNYISWKERLNKLNAMLPKHTILTPHPMELSRLLGIDLSDISHNIFDIANQCSYNNEIVYVIKEC